MDSEVYRIYNSFKFKLKIYIMLRLEELEEREK